MVVVKADLKVSELAVELVDWKESLKVDLMDVLWAVVLVDSLALGKVDPWVAAHQGISKILPKAAEKIPVDTFLVLDIINSFPCLSNVSLLL